ncbi:MAG: D-amino acid aminotransferase [Arcobacter sp.]|nr:D-amino acid aminotransferase [Arcobacter sp.]
MNIVYLNGEFLPKDEAKISVFDRGFIFGDGIYEVFPVIDSKPVDLEGFWERFTRSLGEVELTNPFTKQSCLEMIKTLIAKNGTKEGGVYMQVTRGVAPREFEFLKGLTPTCMAYCFEKNVIDSPLAQKGVKAVSVEDLRWKRRDIKSISLLAQCKAKTEVHNKGAFEGFMIENGHVSEGVSSTAYMVKNGTIITTPLTNEILPGVRRKNIIEIAKKLGLKMEFRHFTIDEVKNADECFVSSATLVIMPIVEMDGVLINGGVVGEISKKLRIEYINNLIKEAENFNA